MKKCFRYKVHEESRIQTKQAFPFSHPRSTDILSRAGPLIPLELPVCVSPRSHDVSCQDIHKGPRSCRRRNKARSRHVSQSVVLCLPPEAVLRVAGNAFHTSEDNPQAMKHREYQKRARQMGGDRRCDRIS